MFFGNFAESKPKDLSDPIEAEEFAKDYEYSSDSDLEDEDEVVSSQPKHTPKSEVHPFDHFATPGEEKIGCERRGAH